MTTNLHNTYDAVIWTKEWLQTIKKHPTIPQDEDAMIEWFSNAIMAGLNHAYEEIKNKDISFETVDGKWYLFLDEVPFKKLNDKESLDVIYANNGV